MPARAVPDTLASFPARRFALTRPQRWGSLVFLAAACIALTAGQLYLKHVAQGYDPVWSTLLALAVPEWLVWGVLAPGVWWLAHRFPVTRARWVRPSLLHLGVGLLVAALHSLAVSGLHEAMGLFGDRAFAITLTIYMAARYPLHLLVYALIVGASAARRHYRRDEPILPETETPDAARYAVRLSVREKGRTVVVPVAAVDYVEAAGNYVSLHLGAKTHLLRSSLRSLEAQLDPAQFARIHRSTLVNLARVAALTPLQNGDHRVRLHDGTPLRLSRTYRAAVQEKLGLHTGAQGMTQG